MWGILNNVYILLGIIVPCISIITTAIGLVRYVRKRQGQLSPYTSSTAPILQGSSSHISVGILHDLDFWDKTTVMGEGLLKGTGYSFITFFITFFTMFIILVLILIFLLSLHLVTMSYAMRVQVAWINIIISCISGLIIGLMVGVVAGVNETKERADEKRKYIQQSLPQNTAQIKIANALIMKSTGDANTDSMFAQFQQQVMPIGFRSWTDNGTIILFASSHQVGEIVNAVEDKGWYSDYSTTELSRRFGKKQTYVKEYREFYGTIYAAVFKDLDADTGYILWSDRKQPALALSQPQDVTCIDWR